MRASRTGGAIAAGNDAASNDAAGNDAAGNDAAGDDRPVPIGHDRALDGLRAISVALVFAFHAGIPGFERGYLGVDVFFVLSGYLITRRLLEERIRHTRVDLRAFYVRRAARLLPAATAVALATAVLASRPSVGSAHRGLCMRQIGSALVYANNVTQVANGEGCRYSVHYWTLSVEEQFYLLWPAAMLGIAALTAALWRDRSGASAWRLDAMRAFAGTTVLAVLIAALNFALGSSGSTEHYALVTTQPFVELLVGAAVGSYAAGRARLPIPGPLILAGAAFAASALVWAPTEGVLGGSLDPWWSFWGGRTAVALATAVVVGGMVGRTDRWTAWLAQPALQFAGKRSYGMYLLHWPIIVAAFELMDLSVGVGDDARAWTARAAAGVGTVVAAAVMYRWLETPAQRWARGRLRGEPRPALAEVRLVPLEAQHAMDG